MLADIRVVLVEPSHPGNIGGAARAMKTMGIHDLALVNPRRFPDPQADWRASQATDVLDAATVATHLEDVIGDCGLVIGTSTRERRIPWPTQTAAEFAHDLAAEGTRGQPVAVLFGREVSGLTNEELQRCNLHLVIPANPAYPSLNLAMAVQVVCYELFKAAEPIETNVRTAWDRPYSTRDELEAFFVHLESVLSAVDFYDPKAPRQAMVRLRRLFERIRADETEVGMLRGVLTHIERAIERGAGEGK